MTRLSDIAPDGPAARRLCLAVVLPDGWRDDPGCARMLERLATSDTLRIVALSHAPRAEPDVQGGLLGRVLALEARGVDRWPGVATPAFDALLPDLPEIGAEHVHAVDVVLDLAGTADTALADRAAQGLWRLSTSAPLAGVAEAMAGAAETRVRLCGLDRADGTWRELAQASYDTKFLATRNRSFQREKAVQLAEHELARRAAGARDRPARPDGQADGEPVSDPGLAGYARRAGLQVARRVADRLRAKVGGRPGRFCLRLAQGTALEFDPAQSVEFDAPAGQYWADPFLIDHPTGLHVFFEVYDYAADRGHIAAGRLEGDRLVPLGPVLTPDYHLSYPFVFAHDGEVFMLPESHQSGRLELWRAVEFPLRWELHRTALEGTPCADSALVEQDGQWWLFTNICRDSFGDFCSELHVFRVDGPGMTRVEPHPLNPVVLGSRVARGGGRVFEEDGRLYRVAQDNSHGVYGYGLCLMEIECLSPRDYRERLVRHVTPDTAGIEGLIGLHHVDALNGRVIFDVRRR